jgi:hypothetical protein
MDTTTSTRLKTDSPKLGEVVKRCLDLAKENPEAAIIRLTTMARTDEDVRKLLIDDDELDARVKDFTVRLLSELSRQAITKHLGLGSSTLKKGQVSRPRVTASKQRKMASKFRNSFLFTITVNGHALAKATAGEAMSTAERYEREAPIIRIYASGLPDNAVLGEFYSENEDEWERREKAAKLTVR